MCFRSAERLELVLSASAGQRKKQMTILHHVRVNVLPVLDDVIIERCRWAHCSCKRERTEVKLIGSGRLPRGASTVAVDSLLTRPSAAKTIVYLDLSSGMRVSSSRFWNLTSCHEVPPRSVAVVDLDICPVRTSLQKEREVIPAFFVFWSSLREPRFSCSLVAE